MLRRFLRPKTPLDYAGRAMKALPKGPQEALRIFEKGLSRFPDDPVLLKGKHGLAQAFGLREAALDATARMVVVQGTAAAWFDRGRSLQDNEQVTEAIAAYRRATELDGKHADSWINLGALLDDARDHQLAVDAYDQALAVAPDDEMAWSNRGNSLTALGRLVEASESYRRGGDIDNLRLTLASLGRVDDVHALQSASPTQGEYRERTREVGERRLVGRFFVGDHGKPALLDSAVDALLDRFVAGAERGLELTDGATIEHLWSRVSLRERGRDLVLCEAVTASDPTRLRESLTVTAVVLSALRDMHGLLGVEPQPCPFPGTLLVEPGALGAARAKLVRETPAHEGDSGWRLRCTTGPAGTLAPISVLRMFVAMPDLGKLVTLPVGWSAELECDELDRVLDPTGTVRRHGG